MRLLNTRLSLICAAVMLCALAAAVLAGCGGSSAADPLDMLLDDTVAVFEYDVEAIDAGEPGDMIVDRFEDYWDSSFGSIGILMEETESLTAGGRAQDGYTILRGEFDFDYIRDDLVDQDYDDDDYRDHELWTGGSTRGLSSVALIEEAGIVLAGDDGAVREILRNLADGRSADDGDMEETLRAMDRAGEGWLKLGISECGGELRGCEAVSTSLAVGGAYEFQHTAVALFRNERTAESQLDDLEKRAEDSDDGSILESVTLDGEFVVVEGTIDEDNVADGFRIERGLSDW